MRVTPRLPVHGPYLQSSYVEMRYFRFSKSSLPLALLFALVEVSSFPHHQSSKPLLQQLAEKCSGPVRRLVALSLDRNVESRHILAAWNSEEMAIGEVLTGFGLYGRTVEEVREMWLERFKVHIVKWGSEEPGRAGISELCWDCGSATSAVLLYRHYSMDSFAVSSCQHIYLKAELYRRTRSAMQRPRTREEMATLTLRCAGDRCTASIQLFAYSQGKADAEISTAAESRYAIRYIQRGGEVEDLYVRSYRETRNCQCCGSMSARQMCVKGCSLCLSCAVSASLTQFGLCCPICALRFRPDVIPEITTARTAIVGLPSPPLWTCFCRQCKAEKPLSAFSLLHGSRHSCWLCDSCLLGMKIEPYVAYQRCSYCADVFSSDRLGLILQIQRENTRKDPLDGKKCVLCGIVKAEKDYFYQGLDSHACQICDICHIGKVLPYAQCLICSKSFPNSRFAAVEQFHCLGCLSTKPKAQFKAHFYLQHQCKLCNFCLASSQKACQACFLPFSPHDSEFIRDNMQLTRQFVARCPCGNLLSSQGYQCSGQCYCSACHFTQILLNRTTNCPKCSSVYSKKPPTSVQCSNCSRVIPTDGLYTLKVSGICSNGHILCQYCIKIDPEDHLFCPFCSSPVQGKPVAELKPAQRSLFLACFCEKEGEDMLGELPCGHVIHWSCRNLLSVCRVCGAKLRERQKEVTIWKYANSF